MQKDSIGLDKEEYRLFVSDAIKNCIVVGGFCKNNCVFCSCRTQNAAGLKNWTKYISMEDLISVLDFINPNKPIFFGEGISFLSCEPFQHPFYLELLRELNKNFSDSTKRTTTICKNIDKKNYEEINNSGLEIVAGINTLDKESRERIMKSEDDLEGVISFLKGCVSSVLKVSLLYTGDLDVLKKDLDEIYSISDEYIEKPMMLRLTDYSKFHNKDTKELHVKSIETWHEAVRYFDKNVKYPEYWIRSLSDFPEDVRLIKELIGGNILFNIHLARESFITRINKIIYFINSNKLNIVKTAFVLSESVYDFFKVRFPYLNAIKVKNILFGGSYMSSRLLTKDDILKSIKDHEIKYDNYFVNKSAFKDRSHKDIMGESILKEMVPYNLFLG